MADYGYSENYIIFLTRYGRIEVVINPLSIMMFFSLSESEMTVSELSGALHTSKTTVQSNINRLVEKGIATKTVDRPGHHNSRYRICASVLLMDGNDIPWNFVDTSNIDYNRIGNIGRMTCTSGRLFDHGIDTWPLVTFIGSEIRDDIFDFIGLEPDTSDHSMRFRLDRFDGTCITISYRRELRVCISNDSISDDRLNIISGLLMGGLISGLPEYTKNNYCHLIKIAMNRRGNDREFVCQPYKGGLFDDFLSRSENDTGMRIPDGGYSIYYANGKSIILTDKTARMILRQLSESDAPLSGLVSKLNISKNTLVPAIAKLLRIGLVSVSNTDHVRDRIYHADCVLVADSDLGADHEDSVRTMKGDGMPEDAAYSIYTGVLARLGFTDTWTDGGHRIDR